MHTIIHSQKNLNSMLSSFDASTRTSQDLYIDVCQWLLKNKEIFDGALWKIYGMDYYTNLHPSLYIAEFSEGTTEENIKFLIAFDPSSMDSLMMKIYNLLWDIAAFKTTIQCINCKDDNFRALIDPETDEIILSCDLCTWSQSLSGKKWSGPRNLIPARKDKLTELKALTKSGLRQ